MVQCAACGFDNRQGARFCKQCGAVLVSALSDVIFPVCQNCGAPLNSEARFCRQCGTSVAVAQVASPIPQEVVLSPLLIAPASSLDPDRSTYARSTRPIPEAELGGVQFADNFPPLVIPPVPEPYPVSQRYVPRWLWVLVGLQFMVIVALVLLIVFVFT